MAEPKRITIDQLRIHLSMILNDIQDNRAEYVVWSGGGRRHSIYPIARITSYKEESGLSNPDAVTPEQ